jgi:hypothetical protein
MCVVDLLFSSNASYARRMCLQISRPNTKLILFFWGLQKVGMVMVVVNQSQFSLVEDTMNGIVVGGFNCLIYNLCRITVVSCFFCYVGLLYGGWV